MILVSKKTKNGKYLFRMLRYWPKLMHQTAITTNANNRKGERKMKLNNLQVDQLPILRFRFLKHIILVQYFAQSTVLVSKRHQTILIFFVCIRKCVCWGEIRLALYRKQAHQSYTHLTSLVNMVSIAELGLKSNFQNIFPRCYF